MIDDISPLPVREREGPVAQQREGEGAGRAWGGQPPHPPIADAMGPPELLSKGLSRKGRGGWRLIASTLLMLAAPAVAEEPKRGGELKVAVTAEPNTLDCHGNATFGVLHHVAPHYSTLLKVDPERYPNLVGDLAASWTVSPDGLVYEFKLRPNVLFHDGSPFSSEDIKATYERLRTASIRKEVFEGIVAIETPDPLVVRFRLKEPDPSMLTVFASPWNCVYSAAKLKEDPKFPEKTVLGTGPFQFVERVPGSHWVGKRFDRYFVPDQPYLDGFRNILMSSSSVVNGIIGGQVDAEFRGLSPAERDRIVASLKDKVTVQEAPWTVMLCVSFNVEKPPFDDARVRRALSLAIDRWSMSQNLARVSLLKGVGGLLRPGYELAASEKEMEQWPGYGRDIAKSRAEAKRLLAEAGVKDLKFTLVNRSINNPYQALAVFLIDQWRQIGVPVEQDPRETSPYFNALGSGGFEAVVDFSTDYVDEPTLQLVKYISRDRSPINYTRATDRTLDELYDKQRRETDLTKRRALVREFEKRELEEAYMVPTLWYQRIVVTTAALKGWKVTPSYLIGNDLAAVWLDR
jgi:peptide/nickel transport system substrate-binding protein